MPHTRLPGLQDIEQAARVVYRQFQARPQYHWGLSSQRLGTDCWIKHENHTPVGAFKIRGGLTYFDALEKRGEPGASWRRRSARNWPTAWPAASPTSWRSTSCAAHRPHRAGHRRGSGTRHAPAALRHAQRGRGRGRCQFCRRHAAARPEQRQVVGSTLCGGNVDSATLASVLGGWRRPSSPRSVDIGLQPNKDGRKQLSIQ